MKKILMYVNSMNALGGIERVIANLSDKFAEDYDVTILVKDEPISAYELNVSVKLHTINSKLEMDMNSRIKRIISVPLNILKSKKALASYLKQREYDFVYTAFPTNGLEVYLADKSYRSKIVASEHASYYAYNRVYRKMKEWLYPRLKHISVPTTMDTIIYSKLGYNVKYIPHLTTYTDVHSNSLCSKRIINIGRLTSDKQQEILLDIWKNVYQRIDDKTWKLQIIGSGEEEEKLKQKIDIEGIKGIEMIPHTNKIAEYYKDASLFVFTSKMEGFGMVLLEAMSFGIPCISFDCPSGPRDIISEGKNGFLVPCYDEEQYADKIFKYIKMDNMDKRRLSNGACNTIREWNNDEIINKWKCIFKD